MKLITASVLCILLSTSSFANVWGNGGTSKSLNSPKFGTHDWIAYKGLLIAQKHGDLGWLSDNLNAFFIGTEAPDLGVRGLLPNVDGTYKDTAKCHCILFDAEGHITNNRLVVRVTEEFNKAKTALSKPHPTKSDYQHAAFYLGAMAHYLGDLSQFMHLMGKQSHWGSENQTVHHAYEAVIDLSIKYQTKTSTVLENYVTDTAIADTEPSTIAVSVARFTETGNNTEADPGWMYTEFKKSIAAGTSHDATEWNEKFLKQTGANVNFAINAVAKLLEVIAAN